MFGSGGGSSQFNFNFGGSGGTGFQNGFGRQGERPSGGQRRAGDSRQEAPELFPKNSQSGIAPLGKAKFPDSSSKYLWVIAFYVNGSKKCIDMKEEFVKFASVSKAAFKVGAVNCARSPQDNEFCEMHGVDAQNLPAFGFMVNGEFSLFDGQRRKQSMKALHDFAVGKLPFHLIQTCNDPQWVKERLQDPAKKQNKLGSILLLTDKYETSPKFVSLAYQFRDYFVFGESRARTLSMAKHYRVKKYPTLIGFIPKKENKLDEFIEVRLEDAHSEDIGKWIENIVTNNISGKKRSKR